MSAILSALLKSKWLIALAIIVTVGIVYGTNRFQISNYEKEAAALKAANEKLKIEAKSQEEQYAKQLNSMQQQAIEVNKKLTALTKANQLLDKEKQVLIKRNEALSKKSAELEVKYAALRKKIADIKVPAGGTDRLDLFRSLGY